MSTVLWLFGLPSAGKTTLAGALAEELRKQGHNVCLLDGDELRKGPCQDLGFSDEDRAENLRRAAQMALAHVEQGSTVVAAFVTPKDKHRALVRDILGDKVRLIHVDCPLEVCMERDVKGLYAKARNGELQGLTGVQDPFERPKNADLRVPTGQLPLEKCVELVMERFGPARQVALSQTQEPPHRVRKRLKGYTQRNEQARLLAAGAGIAFLVLSIWLVLLLTGVLPTTIT